ncbi:hypothetical protein Q5752_000640 [Cryptotrichosporon argae]
MSCADEHHDHSGHGHGGDGHGHDHDHDIPLSAGPSDALYSQIDVDHVVALNAVGGTGAGRKVIKEWAKREDEVDYVESDADDALIIRIPFVSSVSLRSITVKAGPGGHRPTAMRLYANQPGLDFSDVEAQQPVQAFELIERAEGVEYQVKAAKFASLTTLTLFFPGNGGDEDSSRVYYVGLRGTYKQIAGRPGVIVYEAAARPSDHRMEAPTGAAFQHNY